MSDSIEIEDEQLASQQGSVTVRELEDGFICGRSLDDPESVSLGEIYQTREDAIAGAADELSGEVGPGDSFETGKLRWVVESPPNPLDAEGVLDNCVSNASGDWGDASIDTLYDEASPHLADLQQRLDRAWNEWVEAHNLKQRLFFIDDVESHTMGETKDD